MPGRCVGRQTCVLRAEIVVRAWPERRDQRCEGATGSEPLRAPVRTLPELGRSQPKRARLAPSRRRDAGEYLDGGLRVRRTARRPGADAGLRRKPERVSDYAGLIEPLVPLRKRRLVRERKRHWCPVLEEGAGLCCPVSGQQHGPLWLLATLQLLLVTRVVLDWRWPEPGPEQQQKPQRTHTLLVHSDLSLSQVCRCGSLAN